MTNVNSVEMKILSKAEMLIDIAKEYFERTGKRDNVTLARVEGMLDTLTLVTGREYIYDNKGVRVR